LTTKPPSGTRDFLPADIRRREHVVGVVRRVYEQYGYEPLETPAFENIETLLGKYGEEGNKLIFKILRRGEHEASGHADLALRYDLTVPLARVVAQYQNELPKFFKRYQIQPVWRADRPARGRFREFYQCDIDAIGSTSPMVEVELLSAVSDVLETLGFHDFRVLLNHRRVLAGLLQTSGIPGHQHETALVALDKLDKIGESGVTSELATRGVQEFAASRLVETLKKILASGPADQASATNRSRLGTLGTIFASTPYEAAAQELDEIVQMIASTPAANRVFVEPFLARGLSYYTGAIMEIAVPDLAGSLGGGGRYDNLIGMFLGRDVPACGFSLGLERIIVVMTERGMFPGVVANGAADVMISLWSADSRADALTLAGELRRGGLRVDVYPEADKLGKQFKYASSRGFGYVTVVGDDERRAGTVTIKDMTTGHQDSVARALAADHIRQRMTNAREDAR